MRKSVQKVVSSVSVAVALSLAVVPATAPAHAQQTQNLAGLSQKDRQVGAQGYKEIVQEFGGEIQGPLAAYVRRVGLKVALASVPGSKAEDWTITVLNSPVPNAMATPGGYLYITRGLLAMINNEAELASVLGHEAGHVAARHSDKRNNRATIGALGSLAAAVLGGQQVAQLVNTGANAWVAGFSRSQENQADTLGMGYAVKAGYDPYAAATMLAALDRVAAVEGKENYQRSGVNSIFSTHPVTQDRVKRVGQQAQKTGQRGSTNQDAYLAAIAGMAYGDAAEQGVINGPSFRHAPLKLAFDAPAGFTLQNTPQAVGGQGKDGSQFIFAGAQLQSNQSLENLVQQQWQATAGSVPDVQIASRRINQFDARLSSARMRNSKGQQLDVGVNAFRGPDNQVYVIRTMAPAGKGNQFESLIASLRQMNASEIAQAGKGRKIQIHTVRANDTADSIAARMSPPYNRAQSLLALNGLNANEQLRTGQKLKLIVD